MKPLRIPGCDFESNDLNIEYLSSFSFLFSAVLDLSFFLVIVFDIQIRKNKTSLAKNGNKIGEGICPC